MKEIEKLIVSKIVSILDYSDIVWTRYGTESKEELALKILESISELKEKYTL
jgi:hypothetical protein